MNPPEQYYQETGRSFAGAVEGQLFGKPCFKTGGKAFVCFFRDCMVFKLEGALRAEALQLKDAVLFDPSGKGRAMKEWVQVPFGHGSVWPKLAQAAFNYVNGTG